MLLLGNSFCAANGILLGGVSTGYVPAPYSLGPSPMPTNIFDNLTSSLPDTISKITYLQTTASGYKNFLRPNLLVAALGDADFTGQMMKIADLVTENGRTQSLTMNVLRSDYMLQDVGGLVRPLQIELNTIASSFGVLSGRVSQMHSFLHSNGSNDYQFPSNSACEIIVDGFAAAVMEYGKQQQAVTKAPTTVEYEKVVVMVIQPGEKNSIDQFGLQFDLFNRHKIRTVRRSMDELTSSLSPALRSALTQDESTKKNALIFPDNDNNMVEAAVVYFRAGYAPADYSGEETWLSRLLIEKSNAIKCPDIFSHLAGTKKIQQVLASEEGKQLKQFCNGEEEFEEVRNIFAGLWGFSGDENEDKKIIDMALANPGKFVFKPQREGGGNNLYGNDLVNALKTMGGEERACYILMERIFPPEFTQTLVKGGEVVYDGDCVCELGIFGVSLRCFDNDENLLPTERRKGFIVRAKMAKTDEGGVAAGYAFLSSPILN